MRTEKQFEVARLLGQGKTPRQIANECYRYLLGSFLGSLIPAIFVGQSLKSVIVNCREAKPFKCLNGLTQSVNAFVLLRIKYPFSHRFAESKD